jgi:hypothetical protein
MNLVRPFAFVTATLVLATAALAAPEDEHKAHHPADAASAAPATPSGKPGMGPGPAAMQAHMKTMQAMHEKMMGAKTPEERHALMAEHMKTMQDGMSMMQGMKGSGAKAGPAARQQMMEMRMDMMQSMMQMMMDRMPMTDSMPAAPTK